MIMEGKTIVAKEVAEEVVDTTIQLAKKEVAELPEKIGELTEVDPLPDKIDILSEKMELNLEQRIIDYFEEQNNSISERQENISEDLHNTSDLEKLSEEEVAIQREEFSNSKGIKTTEAEDYTVGQEGDSKAEESNELFPEDSDVINNETKKIQPGEVVDEKKCYYDDNGKPYRIGNELVPNSEYTINGYKYTTDDKSRIISAEGGLHMKEREGRLPIKDSIEDIGKGDEKEGDDRGHLIGDQFDGSNGLENMIPQDANINRNDFKNFENELAKEVKDGKEVWVKVEPVYEGDSRRPDAIVVTYSIDGEENVRIFPNS